MFAILCRLLLWTTPK